MKTKPWDVVDHLKTEEDRIRYLEACFEENDPALIAAALGDVARARGLAGLARKTGLTREGLYKAFWPLVRHSAGTSAGRLEGHRPL